MKKVIVIGCPGSGKSTFSRALAEKTGLPLYPLDQMYWNADKTTVDRSKFLERLTAVITSDAWILDGNYASTMEMRLAACDTAFFLDYPTELCLDGVRRRRGTVHADLPWVETEEDAEFMQFIRRFCEVERPRVLALLESYKRKRIVIFQTREEAEQFLKRI